MKDIILTGIRANDEPTIGNYLGAMLPMVELQRKFAGSYQVNMFVPDLHSFTTPINHDELFANTLRNLKYFIAAGLDIDDFDTFIYRQSFIPAHSELTWILDCFTGVGEMSRMTQFKEKSDGAANVTMGLMNYPVLMAADILLYGAKWIPVGEDQTQHLEITRDIAERLNRKFIGVYPGGLFILPEETRKQIEFMGLDKGVRIRSLTDPAKKMSKSIKDPKGTILLSDDPTAAAKKIMNATTDSVAKINFDWENQPGITNLLQILSLLSEKPQSEINADWIGGERYGDLKAAVAAKVQEFLTNFQAKRDNINEPALLAKLSENEEKMNIVANQTLLRVQRAVGLRPRT